MSTLREMLHAYDEQQAVLRRQHELSSSPSSVCSLASASAGPSSNASLASIDEECAAPARARDGDGLSAYLTVEPTVALCAPTRSASASLRASIGLPDLAALPPIRPFEHLATVLPRHAWKKHGSVCDQWDCDAEFAMFDGRRHCRKCGGIFCKAHVARTTPLIDLSRAPGFNPPARRHIHELHSQLTPVSDQVVCDQCHDLIHGVVTMPRTKPQQPSASQSLPGHSSLAAQPTKRRRRKNTDLSFMSAPPPASSDRSHPSSSLSPLQSPLARTPPNALSRTNSSSHFAQSEPASPSGYVPPGLCDENGRPLSQGCATLRMLQLGREGATAPDFDPAVLSQPLGVTQRMAEREQRLRNMGKPKVLTPQELLQTYPLIVPSAVCKARVSLRRKEQHLADMSRNGRLVTPAF